ncbi:hypothetical protein JHK86_006861 [Glycine max]|nr:hypothetical protein JHK86_006861 [Glycine max]
MPLFRLTERENEASLAVLPDLLMELDSMDEVDDFDAFKQRMLGIGDKKPPPYRRDLLFVDNAGVFLELVGSRATVGVPLVVDMNTAAIDGDGGSTGEDEK